MWALFLLLCLDYCVFFLWVCGSVTFLLLLVRAGIKGLGECWFLASRNVHFTNCCWSAAQQKSSHGFAENGSKKRRQPANL